MGNTLDALTETYRTRSDKTCTNSYEANVTVDGTMVTLDTRQVEYENGDESMDVIDGLEITLANGDAKVTIPALGKWWKIPFDPDKTPTTVQNGSEEVFTCYCTSGGKGCTRQTQTNGGRTITSCVPSGGNPCMPCECTGHDVNPSVLLIEAEAVVFNGTTYK